MYETIEMMGKRPLPLNGTPDHQQRLGSPPAICGASDYACCSLLALLLLLLPLDTVPDLSEVFMWSFK